MNVYFQGYENLTFEGFENIRLFDSFSFIIICNFHGGLTNIKYE